MSRLRITGHSQRWGWSRGRSQAQTPPPVEEQAPSWAALGAGPGRVQCRCGAVGGAGAWSAAVVDAQALGDVLAAQRAGAQRRAALLTAAHVAAVEEDHLGLRARGQRQPGVPLPGCGQAPSPQVPVLDPCSGLAQMVSVPSPKWTTEGLMPTILGAWHLPLSEASASEARLLPSPGQSATKMLLIVGPALWLPEKVNEGMAWGGCPQTWVWPVSDKEAGTSPGAVQQGHGMGAIL